MTIEELNIENSKLKSKVSRAATLKDCFLKGAKDNCEEKIVNAYSARTIKKI